ncbi:MAG: hypothetical protein IJK02_07825 [Clostridia bacterium]|nr:hypothetical protein [Clostridia bacterium]
MKTKRIVACLMLLILLFSAGCAGRNSGYTPPDYTYTPSQPAVTEQAQADEIPVNTAWQKNYAIEYKYFDRSESEDAVRIEEKRSTDSFYARYPDSGSAVFYKRSAGAVEQYTIVPSEDKYIHRTLTGKNFDTLSSTFMKLSALSAHFTTLSGVRYIGDEEIAGRQTKRYEQTAYENNEVSETANVWVDLEYGFAIKCEAYGKDGVLTASWEALSFSVGDVAAKDATLDISGYTFTEE